MSTQLQLRRGTTAETAGFTGAVAEATVDTTQNTIVVHDGTTMGGHYLVTKGQFEANLTNITTFTESAYGVANVALESAQTASSLAQAAYDKANNSGPISSSSLVNGQYTLELTPDGEVSLPITSTENSIIKSNSIISLRSVNPTSNFSATWNFDEHGILRLPPPGEIVFANGVSVFVKTDIAIAAVSTKAENAWNTANATACTIQTLVPAVYTAWNVANAAFSTANAAFSAANNKSTFDDITISGNTISSSSVINLNGNTVSTNVMSVNELKAKIYNLDLTATGNIKFQTGNTKQFILQPDGILRLPANGGIVYANGNNALKFSGNTINFDIGGQVYNNTANVGSTTTELDFDAHFGADYHQIVPVGNSVYELYVVNPSPNNITELESLSVGTSLVINNGTFISPLPRTIVLDTPFVSNGSGSWIAQFTDTQLSVGMMADVTNIKIPTTTIQPNQVIDTFDKTKFRTVKYLIQSVSGYKVHSFELLLTHNDVDVFLTEYATVRTSNTDLVTTSATISSGTVSLVVTPADSNTTIDFVRTSLTARTISSPPSPGGSSSGDMMALSGTEDLMAGSGSEDLMV